MSFRKSLRPRFDSLESKTVMSAGASTAAVAAVAHYRPVAAHHAEAQTDQSISLTGEADGYYTSSQRLPDARTRYQLTAEGTIAPVGAAVVTGSFHTPGMPAVARLRATCGSRGRTGHCD